MRLIRVYLEFPWTRYNKFILLKKVEYIYIYIFAGMKSGEYLISATKIEQSKKEEP